MPDSVPTAAVGPIADAAQRATRRTEARLGAPTADAELVAAARTQCVMLHQLGGQAADQGRIEAALERDRRHPGVFLFGTRGEFPGLAREVSEFRVGLRTDDKDSPAAIDMAPATPATTIRCEFAPTARRTA